MVCHNADFHIIFLSARFSACKFVCLIFNIFFWGLVLLFGTAYNLRDFQTGKQTDVKRSLSDKENNSDSFKNC